MPQGEIYRQRIRWRVLRYSSSLGTARKLRRKDNHDVCLSLELRYFWRTLIERWPTRCLAVVLLIPMNNDDAPEQEEEKRILRREKRAARFITFCALYLAPALLLAAVLGHWAVSDGANRWISLGTVRLISAEVLRDHFAAVVGLPMAGILALWVVTILRSQTGPIEFEAMGFKLRGASGPVILWVVCFLAIALAIRLLW